MKHILSRVISIFTLFFMANWCHAEGVWELVTDVSILQTGDKVIIVAKDYDRAMGTTQNSNNRNAVVITKNTASNTCTITDKVQQLTLQQGTKSGSYAFYTGDGYLYAASSNDNYLRTESALSDNSSWNISIASDGTSRVIAQGGNKSNDLKYNSDSYIFSSYSSPNYQASVLLYKYSDIELIPATLTLSDGGVIEIEDVYVNDSYVLPTRDSSVEGLEFMGWSRTPIVAGASIPSGTLLSPGSSVKVEENLIFYAVYAKPVYDGEKAYVKIGPEQEDLTGDYLIVYEKGSKVFNGSLGDKIFEGENAADIEIPENKNKIVWNEGIAQYEFRIDKYGEGYSVKSKSGYYIGYKNGSALATKILSSNCKFTVLWSEKYSPIKVLGAYLCYASKNFSFNSNEHTPIQLYKRTDVTKSYAYYTTFASISVNSYGYATWYSGIPVEVPAGVTAYTCQVEGNTAMLHAVGAVIPAHTGVVLYAPEAVGKGQNFVLRYADVDTTPIANNALIGFVKDTEVDNGKAHYALNVKDKKVGFYIPKTTTTETEPSATSAFTAKAGKAYLELDAQVSVSALALKRIDDVSVNHISTSSDDIIYDLMGRKVSAPSQGVYIVNGRKVVLTGEKYKTK
ncbi:MAG: hypothetical protein IKV15_07795 [Bacteroidaceae bacterium]|nr:hypothetical protein [Bacteroidaceae bacterium]